MVFEIFAVLWLIVLMFAIYFFAKSLSAAFARSREPRIIGDSKSSRIHAVAARHASPTGHRGRTPAH